MTPEKKRRVGMHREGCVVALACLAVIMSLPLPSQSAELPAEHALWEKAPARATADADVQEQLRTNKPAPGSPSGTNRVFSAVTVPTYTIHRPAKPNGVGLVICPGGGFRDVWIDREGHDLALRLKEHGITSLVLKYRTRLPGEPQTADSWRDYQVKVEADGREAIRVLRRQAEALGLDRGRIGICGFSAGGQLAIMCSLYPVPKTRNPGLSGVPNFAGLFYPGIPEGIDEVIESRTAPESATAGICPMFIINARRDRLTPADQCVDFYANLLAAGVNAELHIFSKGSHGFDLGTGRGESAALWPTSFMAWLRDIGMIEE